MTIDLTSRVAVVTGAGMGVGRSLARGLVEDGARVVGISRTVSDLEETRRLAGDGFSFVVGDISKAEDVERLFAHAEATLGPVDIVVNNAAVYPKVAFLEQEMDAFESALLTNVMGVARCCHRALPSMLDRGFGRIVNVGSYAFLAPIPNSAVYSASKGAVTALTKAIAVEIDHDRYPDVLVNELMPGIFRTRMAPDQGEDPSAAYTYLRPVVTLPNGGPHGQIFLKGELQEDQSASGGIRTTLKRFLERRLGL